MVQWSRTNSLRDTVASTKEVIMKRLATLLLLILFVLPGCKENAPEIDMVMPTEPPNPVEMQPTSPPGSNSSANDFGETQ